MNIMNAISFDKGCYLGQELTQWTYRTGTIRKRVLPFIGISIDSEFEIKSRDCMIFLYFSRYFLVSGLKAIVKDDYEE